jgi:hypothetical protein
MVEGLTTALTGDLVALLAGLDALSPPPTLTGAGGLAGRA